MSINVIGQATRIAPSHFDSALDPADIWRSLVSGRARIVDSGVTDAHHYFQLVWVNQAPGAKPLSKRRIGMLERVLSGDAPKVVAMETGCAASTVAIAVGDCLRAMGLDHRSSRVPALLVLILHAQRGEAQRLSVQIERSPGQRDERRLVSSARLEQCLNRRLSAGELAVVSLLVEGKTYVEIAEQRKSAVRTVANQIASVYRKLGISGRIDLIRYLVAASSLTN